MRFSIVIPTYNNYPELERCLHSLEKLVQRDFEVFVCVDGSKDGTFEKLSRVVFNFPIQVFQHPGNKNRGRSASRNLALEKITGEFTLFLDSDMEVKEDLLDTHLEMLKEGNTISIGEVIYRNQKKNRWARYTSERGVGKFKHGAEVPFNYFITPDTAIPSAWLKDSGGFDEAIYRYGGEDTELGYRIFKKYSPLFRFNKNAAVFTVQDKSLDAALIQLKEFGAIGMRYLTKKFPELSKLYWVDKCDSQKFKDKIFEFFTNRSFRVIARLCVRIFPYFMAKPFINYLVIAHVHEGYRSGKKQN